MNNKSSLLIVVLMVSAALLGIMIYGSASTVEAASAGDATVDRDYIIVTGDVSGSSCVLYVIHVPTQNLVAYVANRSTNSFVLVDAAKMSQVFSAN